MSRYVILLLLNLPFIALAILSVVTRYKLKQLSLRKTLSQIAMWLVILVGLLIAQPLYEWLSAEQYTDTESLSLFDVIQITAIVIIFYIANRLRAKAEYLERRFNDLHREVSIKLSTPRDKLK